MSGLFEARLLLVTTKTGGISDGIARAHRFRMMPRREEPDRDARRSDQHGDGDLMPAKPHAAALRRRSHHIASGPTIASARIGGDT